MPSFLRPPYLRAFWNRAYQENVTGLAGMVAFNLMLALFPFALLVLFVAGQVIRSPDIEASILSDLQRLFPNVEQDTLMRNLDRVRDSSTTIGIAAIVGGLWIGASFWGAMDTAFCRIYHVDCRSWVEQKRFSFVMVGVVMAFLAASVIIPTLEGALVTSTDKLPLGLSETRAVTAILLIFVALGLTFAISCVTYWSVPKGHMPWKAVWPGALFLTIATGIANWLFPVYLSNVSSVGEFEGTVGLVLIALIWFYALSLGLLAGAVINALRHELEDTGAIKELIREDAKTDQVGKGP